jgi:hypothetical protein
MAGAQHVHDKIKNKGVEEFHYGLYDRKIWKCILIISQPIYFVRIAITRRGTACIFWVKAVKYFSEVLGVW